MAITTVEVTKTITTAEDRYDVLQYLTDHTDLIFCPGGFGKLTPYDDEPGLYNIELDPTIRITDAEEWDVLENHTPFQPALFDEFPDLGIYLVLLNGRNLEWIVAANNNELAKKYAITIVYTNQTHIPVFIA
jgi:hypothetical protein